MEYIHRYGSQLGEIFIASDGTAITGLWIEGQKYFADILDEETVEKELPVFELTRQWLDCYFQGKEPEFIPPVALHSSEFRMDVWEILQQIPYGETVTYGMIAKKIAEKRGKKIVSAQAVGSAVGHNPIAIIVPCHRVVGSNGNLTGYAGGIDKKVRLLELEHVDMEKLFVPKKGTAL